MDQLLKRPIGAESRGKRSRGHHGCVHPKTKFFPKSEREREWKNKKRRVPPFSSSLRDMSSKPEPKDAHQLNGTGPAASACSSEGPGREPLAGTSEFLGPDGAEVEVVVPESRANAKGLREEDALLENGSQSNESDDVSSDHGPAAPSPLKETSFSIGLQVLFPFLLAGFGTVAAGMVLDIVQVGAGRAALDTEPRAIFSSWETVS